MADPQGGFEQNSSESQARDCQAASELVAQALALCNKAGFELAAILLDDARNVLAKDLGDLSE
ncbi:MAG: hypothetical protein ACRDZO_14340 [Egibacteraceae bacterium]